MLLGSPKLLLPTSRGNLVLSRNPRAPCGALLLPLYNEYKKQDNMGASTHLGQQRQEAHAGGLSGEPGTPLSPAWCLKLRDLSELFLHL